MNKPTLAQLSHIDIFGTKHPKREDAAALTLTHLTKGASHLNLALDPSTIAIKFDLTGRAAGQASYHYKAQQPKAPKAPLSLDDLTDLDILNPGIPHRLAHQITPRATELRIRFNYPLMCANASAFFTRTIPHEVAHILSVAAYGKAGHGHGAHWRHICTTLGMQDVTRCHSYDTTATAKRQRKWLYTCTCTEHNVHNLSTTLHNRIQRGQQARYCKTCHTTLHFSRTEQTK